jgi:hypothetical protein
MKNLFLALLLAFAGSADAFGPKGNAAGADGVGSACTGTGTSDCVLDAATGQEVELQIDGTTGLRLSATTLTSIRRALFPDGDANAPGIAFSSADDGTGTGIYRTAGDTMSFVTNGSGRLSITSGGTVTVGGAMNVNGNTTLGDAATDTTAILGPISNSGAGTPTGCSTAGAVCVSDAAGLEAVGGAYVKEGTATTTDATPTTVLSYTPTDGTVGYLSIVCSARTSDGSQGASYRLDVSYRRQAGTTIVGVSNAATFEDNASWHSTASAASPAINVQGTGAGATTIAWRCRAVDMVVAP